MRFREPARGLFARVVTKLREVPRLVWAATATMFTLLLGYSLLFPMYVAPDEPQHVDMVIALRHDAFSWPAPAKRALAQGVAQSSDPIYSRGPVRVIGPYRLEGASRRADRKSIAELGGNAPSLTPPRYPNQLVQHPPLYYAVNAAIIRIIPGSDAWSYDVYVWFLRFVSACMTSLLPLLAWATTRRMTGADGVAARVAAVTPLLIPGLLRIGSSVNNDNLVTLLSALTFFTLVPVALGEMSRSRAVKVGAVLGLALLSKMFAVAFIPIVGLAYLTGWRRHNTKFPLAPAAIAGVVTFVCGGWWHLRNRVVFGSFVPNGWGKAAFARITAKYHPQTVNAFGKWRNLFVPRMHNRFWGTIGLLEPPELSRMLTMLLTLTVIALSGVAMVRGVRWTGDGIGRAAERRPRRDLVVFGVAPAVLILLIVAQGTYSEFRRSGIPGGMQGRYLYPAVVPLAAAVCAGLIKHRRRWHQWIPLAVVCGAAAMQVYAIRLIIKVVWTPPIAGSSVSRLHRAWGAFSAWSPLPSGASMAIVIAILISGASLGLSSFSYAIRRSDGGPMGSSLIDDGATVS